MYAIQIQKYLTLILAGVGFLLQTACASHKIIRDQDYTASVIAFQGASPEQALKTFPKSESGGLITDIEKSWIGLWANQTNPKRLANHAENLEKRKVIWISHEAATALSEEAEEDYLPSEPEIIALYLVQATELLQSNQREAAKVELRRASWYLDQQWDDPSLRLWLSALWQASGDWEEARVDLRRASELSGDPRYRKLAQTDRPPESLTLHFAGVSPTLSWDPLQFKPQLLKDPTPTLGIEMVSTRPWFTRQLEKDHSVRDLARSSNHYAQLAGNETLSGAGWAFTKGATWGIRIVGIAVGAGLTVGVFYVLAQSGSLASGGGEALIGLTIGVGVGIFKIGQDLDRRMMRSWRKSEKEKSEGLRSYRLVRFMPAWVGLTETSDLTSASVKDHRLILKNGVSLIHHF